MRCSEAAAAAGTAESRGAQFSASCSRRAAATCSAGPVVTLRGDEVQKLSSALQDAWLRSSDLPRASGARTSGAAATPCALGLRGAQISVSFSRRAAGTRSTVAAATLFAGELREGLFVVRDSETTDATRSSGAAATLRWHGVAVNIVGVLARGRAALALPEYSLTRKGDSKGICPDDLLDCIASFHSMLYSVPGLVVCRHGAASLPWRQCRLWRLHARDACCFRSYARPRHSGVQKVKRWLSGAGHRHGLASVTVLPATFINSVSTSEPRLVA